MKITICGSLNFFKEMRQAQKLLERRGHKVFVPKSLDLLESGKFKKPETIEERLEAEKKYNFIIEHFDKVKKSDAILVLNYDKNGTKNYIGGNTFLEMGIAFWFKKRIYILNPLPDMIYSLELYAMKPKILKGDLGEITSSLL